VLYTAVTPRDLAFYSTNFADDRFAKQTRDEAYRYNPRVYRYRAFVLYIILSVYTDNTDCIILLLYTNVLEVTLRIT